MNFGYTDWLVLILSLLGLIVLYAWNKNQFFKRINVNHLKPNLFFGSMLQVILGRKHAVDVMTEAHNAFPDDKYVGVYNFMDTSYVIKDLDLIKQITVKDFDHFVDHINFFDKDIEPLMGSSLFALTGEKWREMRTTLSPAFTGAKMRGMFPFIIKCAENLVEYLNLETEKSSSKENGYVELNTKEITGCYTNDVIATCAFGYQCDSFNDKTNKFITMTKEFTEFTFRDNVILMLHEFSPKITKALGLVLSKKTTSHFFRTLVMNSINDRKKNKFIRHDMIHLLMLAQQGSLNSEIGADDNDQSSSVIGDKLNNKNSTKKTKWTEDELTAQAMIFLFAGFDTSSTAISFLFHELAVNQDVQKKLQEEIDDVIDIEKFEYSDLNKMKYLDMVVTETLRLWTPAPILDRICIKPYTLPVQNDKSEYKHKLKIGDMLWISAFDIQRDPKYYPDPEKFIPERFSDGNSAFTNTAKYLPFGIGPRACIGSRFALMEMKIIALYILSNFDIVATPKTSNPVKIEPHMFNIAPDKGFWIGVKKRNKN